MRPFLPLTLAIVTLAVACDSPTASLSELSADQIAQSRFDAGVLSPEIGNTMTARRATVEFMSSPIAIKTTRLGEPPGRFVFAQRSRAMQLGGELDAMLARKVAASGVFTRRPELSRFLQTMASTNDDGARFDALSALPMSRHDVKQSTGSRMRFTVEYRYRGAAKLRLSSAQAAATIGASNRYGRTSGTIPLLPASPNVTQEIYMNAEELAEAAVYADAIAEEAQWLIDESTAAWELAGSPGDGGDWPVAWESPFSEGSLFRQASCNTAFTSSRLAASAVAQPCLLKHTIAIGGGFAAMLAARDLQNQARAGLATAIATGGTVAATSVVAAKAAAAVILAGAAILAYDAIWTCSRPRATLIPKEPGPSLDLRLHRSPAGATWRAASGSVDVILRRHSRS